MNRESAARVAALTRWAKAPDRASGTAAARSSAFAKFERQVDPDGTLPPAERQRRAKAAQRAHMIRIRAKRGAA